MIGWHVFDDAQSMGQKLAKDVEGRLRAAIEARGQASLIVPGGRSPVLFFSALSAAPLDWARVSIGLTDERIVEPASPDKSEKLVRDRLLVGAARGARFIRELAGVPRPHDEVVIGMGEDGHFASLFPGATGLAEALDEAAAPGAVTMRPPAAANERITMNLAALLESRHIVLLVPGAAKRATFERARAGASPLELPIAALLRQERVPLDVYATH